MMMESNINSATILPPYEEELEPVDNLHWSPETANSIYLFWIPQLQASTPASDISSVYTALKRSQMISTWVGGDDSKTVISLDLDLYTRAYNLVHCRTDLRDKFIIHLGELHTIFAHLRAMGSFIENSGIDVSWLEADVYGPNTIRQIINCSHMKRSV
ncbi:hypothetical protein LOTGIDRAFT_171396 [Lottia gigantea]|uniref:Uncharacterized protein n=1 Tax=Lottia gigantea TaxID=225164 RepID=V4BBN2_LOTGI|nr:hypothetical protein LOTGIDRAFT_171396 [Lottia gigantea]ESP03457.1 hypothetical protein LOTGIDRAFT_171396 [Lottia gigantea]